MDERINLSKAFYSNSHACLLLSNNAPLHTINALLATGAKESFSATGNPGDPEAFGRWLQQQEQPVFGHIAYDTKNLLENLSSTHTHHSGFGLISFFAPETVLELNDLPEDFTHIATDEPDEQKPLQISARTSRTKYMDTAAALLRHIQRGDIYEINYCIEFYAEKVQLDPVNVFLRLNALALAPFTALYRQHDNWLICASPERFLKRTGDRLISQPIKGTRPRGKNKEADELLKEELRNDPKERSENIMIVDLVRNDLSKIAAKGSVHVDELCGIYTFPTVHQMISTVSATAARGTTTADLLRAAFPMGSMTGAPKISAMQLIEKYEDMYRGIYSGALGYIRPSGDLDLNVVIRSITYNARTGYLSFKVGSAITAACDPEKEYEECLVKANALLLALNAVLI